MDGRTFSRGWPDLFKNKPGLFRMEYSIKTMEQIVYNVFIGKQYCSFEFNGSCVFATVRTVYIYSRRYHSCNCLHKEDQLLKKDSWFIRKRKRMILFLKIG